MPNINCLGCHLSFTGIHKYPYRAMENINHVCSQEIQATIKETNNNILSAIAHTHNVHYSGFHHGTMKYFHIFAQQKINFSFVAINNV